ncbi:MAG TPA: hypothetical protein VFR27_07135 [Mycobacterium sp.]|nr:hypothetical protein [Mycobacterium sp.]
MGPRRAAPTAGAIAGGLLAFAFVPMAFPSAIAVADDASDASVFGPLLQNLFGFTHDASQPTTVTWVSGEPPFFQSIHQSEFFNSGATGTLPAGSFQTNNEVISTAYGPASLEVLVTSSDPGTSAPPVGSVYDVINIGAGFENVYADIAPTTPGGSDTLSDTLVTPFGDIPLMTRLHAFLDPANSYFLYQGADPVAGPTAPSTSTSTDDTTSASVFFSQFFGEFFGFSHDASTPTTVTGIAAIPPFYQSVHQTLVFDTNPTATLPAGSFQATNNILTYPTRPGFSELLVTRSEEGTSAPPVGSVYEITNKGHGFENVYADIAPTTPGGPDTLSDTLVTPFGNIPLMTNLHTFFDSRYSFFLFNPADSGAGAMDSSAANSADDTATQPFAFFGFTHDASQPTTVISVSGEPPSFNSVHQAESFFSDPTGTLPAGSFQANSNVITHASGLGNYEILVINSAAGTSAPPVGSVYDVNNIAHGFENFYSDIAPTTAGGSDTLSDTLVTPFGDIPILTDFHSFLNPTDLFFPY